MKLVYKGFLVLMACIVLLGYANALFFDKTYYNILITGDSNGSGFDSNGLTWASLNVVVPWHDANLFDLNYSKLFGFPSACPVGFALKDFNGNCVAVGGSGSSQPYVVPWTDVNVSLTTLSDGNIASLSYSKLTGTPYVFTLLNFDGNLLLKKDVNFTKTNFDNNFFTLWNLYYDSNWLKDYNAVIIEWSKISNKPYIPNALDWDNNYLLKKDNNSFFWNKITDFNSVVTKIEAGENIVLAYSGSDRNGIVTISALSPLTETYYPTDKASNIAGFDVLQAFPDANSGSDSVSVSSGTGKVLIDEYITDVNNPYVMVIPSGTYTFNNYVSISSGSGVTKFDVNVWKRDLAGVETYFMGTTTPEVNEAVSTLYVTTYALANNQDVNLTDRFVVRWYVTNDHAVAKTATLYYGGATTYTHIDTSVPRGGDSGFVRYVGSSKNLFMPDFNIVASWFFGKTNWNDINGKPYFLEMFAVDANLRPSIDANRLAAIQQVMAIINPTIDANRALAEQHVNSNLDGNKQAIYSQINPTIDANALLRASQAEARVNVNIDGNKQAIYAQINPTIDANALARANVAEQHSNVNIDTNRGRIDTNTNTWRKTDSNSIVSHARAGTGISISCSGSDLNGDCQIASTITQGITQALVSPQIDGNLTLAKQYADVRLGNDNNFVRTALFNNSTWQDTNFNSRFYSAFTTVGDGNYVKNALFNAMALVTDANIATTISRRTDLNTLRTDINQNFEGIANHNKDINIVRSDFPTAGYNITIANWDGNFLIRKDVNFTKNNFDSNFKPAFDNNNFVNFKPLFDSNYFSRFKPDFDGNVLAYKTSILDGNYLKKSDANGQYVDMFNTQTIIGLKTFNNNFQVDGNFRVKEKVVLDKNLNLGTTNNGIILGADSNSVQLGKGTTGTNFCMYKHDFNFIMGFC